MHPTGNAFLLAHSNHNRNSERYEKACKLVCTPTKITAFCHLYQKSLIVTNLKCRGQRIQHVVGHKI